ncbi:unnamed protein product, partial [Prorocentrum cordatum]
EGAQDQGRPAPPRWLASHRAAASCAAPSVADGRARGSASQGTARCPPRGGRGRAGPCRAPGDGAASAALVFLAVLQGPTARRMQEVEPCERGALETTDAEPGRRVTWTLEAPPECGRVAMSRRRAQEVTTHQTTPTQPEGS